MSLRWTEEEDLTGGGAEGVCQRAPEQIEIGEIGEVDG